MGTASTPFLDAGNRKLMPHVLTGAELAPLQGARISQLALFASLDEGFGPIPFQVDEKDASGRFVYRGGGQMGSDDGLLDANDELVFMLKDSGPQFPKPFWPAGVRRGLEIEMTDSLDSTRRGYVYLLEFEGPPRYASRDYIQFDPKNYRVTTGNATMAVNPRHPVSHVEYRLADSKGQLGPNLLDRVKIRPSAWTLGELIRFSETEETLNSRITAWTDGPVRVIYELENTFKLGPIPLVRASTAWIFYEHNYAVPVRVQVPGLIRTFTSRVEAEITLDFRDMTGATFSSNVLPQGVTIRGGERPDDDHRRDIGLGGWMLLGRGNQSIYMEIDLDKTLPVKVSLVYWDNKTGTRAPESVPGQLPEAGFRIHDWTELDRSIYEFYVGVYILTEPPDQGGNGLFKTIHTPLTVRHSTGTEPIAIVAGSTVPQEVISALEAAGVRIERTDITGAIRKMAQGPVSLLVMDSQPEPAVVRAISHSRIPAVITRGRGQGGLFAGISADTGPDRLARAVGAIFPKGTPVVLIAGPGAENARRAETYITATRAAGLDATAATAKSEPELAAILRDRPVKAILVGDDPLWDSAARYQMLVKTAGSTPVIGTSRQAVLSGAALAIASEFSGDWKRLIDPLLRRQKPGAEAMPLRIFVNPDAIRRTGLTLPPSLLQIAERATP
ncbi:MAG: hypothetical protein KIT79_01320 [Deltaproteobacteria bacterium]|nr:hypothetical protein [Deltaproteobacteria bacterium]